MSKILQLFVCLACASSGWRVHSPGNLQASGHLQAPRSATQAFDQKLEDLMNEPDEKKNVANGPDSAAEIAELKRKLKEYTDKSGIVAKKFKEWEQSLKEREEQLKSSSESKTQDSAKSMQLIARIQDLEAELQRAKNSNLPAPENAHVLRQMEQIIERHQKEKSLAAPTPAHANKWIAFLLNAPPGAPAPMDAEVSALKRQLQELGSKEADIASDFKEEIKKQEAKKADLTAKLNQLQSEMQSWEERLKDREEQIKEREIQKMKEKLLKEEREKQKKQERERQKMADRERQNEASAAASPAPKKAPPPPPPVIPPAPAPGRPISEEYMDFLLNA